MSRNKSHWMKIWFYVSDLFDTTILKLTTNVFSTRSLNPPRSGCCEFRHSKSIEDIGEDNGHVWCMDTDHRTRVMKIRKCETENQHGTPKLEPSRELVYLSWCPHGRVLMFAWRPLSPWRGGESRCQPRAPSTAPGLLAGRSRPQFGAPGCSGSYRPTHSHCIAD